MPNKIEQYAARLIAGADGGALVKEIEEAHASYVANDIVSKVRMLVLDSADTKARGPRYLATLSKLQKYLQKKFLREESAKVTDAVKLGRRAVYKLMRRVYAFSDDDEARNLLSQVDIFPSNMENFRMSAKLKKAVAKYAQQKQDAKNKSGITLSKEEWTGMLQQCLHVLVEAPNRNDAIGIGAALAFASGRRSSEIMSGASTFTPIDGKQAVMFDGQLKKISAAKPYVVPLLCDVDVFMKAYAHLRLLQGQVVLSPLATNARYKTGLAAAARKYNENFKMHDLRRLYVVLAYRLFGYDETGVTENMFIMLVLGHAWAKEALAYNNVIVQGAQKAISRRLRPAVVSKAVTKLTAPLY